MGFSIEENIHESESTRTLLAKRSKLNMYVTARGISCPKFLVMLGLRHWCILSKRLHLLRELNKRDKFTRKVFFFFFQSSMPCSFIAFSKSGVKTHNGLFPVVWRCFFL